MIASILYRLFKIKSTANLSREEKDGEKVKFVLDKSALMEYYTLAGCDAENLEKSRSWPSAHDWKSCIPQKGIEGSNPSFSAIN